jgi:hypothetical protein
MSDNEPITVTELRRLLVDIHDKRPDICLRFRLLGEMWGKNFLKILAIGEKSIVLAHEQDGRLYTIPDLSKIMQFELDSPFHQYKPYFHYSISAVPVF